jgi:hypothetical protein
MLVEARKPKQKNARALSEKLLVAEAISAVIADGKRAIKSKVFHHPSHRWSSARAAAACRGVEMKNSESHNYD